MNNKKNYKKGERLEITKAVYAGGCVSYRSLKLISERENQNEITRIVRRMRDEGKIEIVKSKGVGKHIIVKEWEKNYEKEMRPYMDERYKESCQRGMEEYGRSRRGMEDEEKRQRVVRQLNMSETVIMMHRSGVGAYPDETEEIGEYLREGKRERAVFYQSSELKKMGYYFKAEKDQDVKYQTSRIYGMLISAGGLYAVYNMADKLIEWTRYGEVKMQHHLKTLTRGMQREEEELGCMVLASDIRLFARVITNEYKSRERKRGAQILLNIDYAYEEMYGIPTTREGIEVIRLMSEENWKEDMERILLAGCTKKVRSYSIICDGVSREDGYVLLFCNGNITRLKGFLQRAVNASEDEKFCIYCFSFQTPLLASLETGNIRCKEVSLWEYIKRKEELKKGEWG